MRTRSGHTLLELALVLGIGGSLFLLATPSLQHARDLMATRAARDYLLTQLALARVAAPAHGGAEVVLDTAAAQVLVRSAARVHSRSSLRDHFGVELTFPGQAAATATLRFDALGLGRMASRTVAVSRGRARAHLSISAYGRARSW